MGVDVEMGRASLLAERLKMATDKYINKMCFVLSQFIDRVNRFQAKCFFVRNWNPLTFAPFRGNECSNTQLLDV